MQNRYVADAGDFAKHGLLRRLSWATADDDLEPLRLGLVWYMHQEEHGADGKHITYLSPTDKNEKRFGACDPDLWKMLGEFVREGRRCVRHVQEAGILPPDTLYHGGLLHYPPDTNRPSRQAMRDLWFAGALQATADADLVCVDPDNGIAKPDQMYQRRGPKFTYISDLRAFWERGQSLVVYQHLGHNVPAEAQIAAKAALLRDELGVEPIPLRFRRGSRPRLLHPSSTGAPGAHRRADCPNARRPVAAPLRAGRRRG